MSIYFAVFMAMLLTTSSIVLGYMVGFRRGEDDGYVEGYNDRVEFVRELNNFLDDKAVGIDGKCGDVPPTPDPQREVPPQVLQ